MKLFVYRFASGTESGPISDLNHCNRWRPTFGSWIPPGKDWKYIFYTAFHWLRIFRNRDYSWLALSDNVLKASMLCVPSYFKWPFMASNDIQFTYVMTTAAARGQGWGSRLLQTGIERLSEPGRSFWYITDEKNIASQKLALRSGFEFVGTAVCKRALLKRVQLIRDGESIRGYDKLY